MKTVACNKLIEGDAIAEVSARWIPVGKVLGSSLNGYNFFFCGFLWQDNFKVSEKLEGINV